MPQKHLHFLLLILSRSFHEVPGFCCVDLGASSSSSLVNLVTERESSQLAFESQPGLSGGGKCAAVEFFITGCFASVLYNPSSNLDLSHMLLGLCPPKPSNNFDKSSIKLSILAPGKCCCGCCCFYSEYFLDLASRVAFLNRMSDKNVAVDLSDFVK